MTNNYDYDCGDKFVVVEVCEGFENDYSVGDVFTFAHFYDEDEDIIIAADGTEFYDWEVAPYEEGAEDLNEYEELSDSLSQAIAMKAAEMSETEADGDIPKLSTVTQLYFGNEPGHMEHIAVLGVRSTDAVEHPSHYTQGAVEVIDIIAQTVSGYSDGFTAHCVGTTTKYLNRAPHKHATPLEDLRKAAKYLEFAIKHEEGKQ